LVREAKMLNLLSKIVVTEKGLLGFAALCSRLAGCSSAPRTPSKPFGELNRSVKPGL
jgi:hypothetical protein